MMLMMMVHLLVNNNSSKEILLHTLSHGGEEEEKFRASLKEWLATESNLSGRSFINDPSTGGCNVRASSDE